MQATFKALVAVAALTLAGQAPAGDPPRLAADHPEEYIVVEGDTLWDIADRFLEDPWRWPDVWHVNPDIANPHLIYPGDLIRLVYVDGEPRLEVAERPTVHLSPQIRVERLERPIPTIPLDVVQPFLTRPQVLSQEEIDAAPYVVAFSDGRLLSGAGDNFYARGMPDEGPTEYTVLRIGDEYVDPETDEVLGIEAVHVGYADLHRRGDPATLLLTSTSRESRRGDRLFPVEEEPFRHRFLPRAPDHAVDGHILSVFDGIGQIGQHRVVAISRGTDDGLEVGHALAVYQTGRTVRDDVVGDGEEIRLPDERAGMVLVFRTYDRVSFALVMRTTRPIHIHDAVRRP